METEVVVARQAGELRREDVRAALGDRYFTTARVRVTVLGQPGQPPAVTDVGLGWLPAGRAGAHRAVLCPDCSRPCRVLYVDGQGALGCAGCVGYLTRHQRLGASVDYRHGGGREEDRLLRILSRPGITAAAIDEAQRLCRKLVEIDSSRARALLPMIMAAIAATAPNETILKGQEEPTCASAGAAP